jgi:hypothetical protein
VKVDSLKCKQCIDVIRNAATTLDDVLTAEDEDAAYHAKANAKPVPPWMQDHRHALEKLKVEEGLLGFA